jgi:hypothetical protein
MQHFPNCAPHESGQDTGEEDVVRVLHLSTEGTSPRRWPPTPTNVVIGGQAFTHKLPEEDPDLERDSNPQSTP